MKRPAANVHEATPGSLAVKWSSEISPHESEELGLAWREHYVLLAVDFNGAKFSLVGNDLEYGKFAMSARMPDGSAPARINMDKFPIMFRGWLAPIVNEIESQGLTA